MVNWGEGFDPNCPLPDHMHLHQMQNLENINLLEDAFAFCHNAELAMIALDHVRPKNEFLKFKGVLKKGRQFIPGAPP